MYKKKLLCSLLAVMLAFSAFTVSAENEDEQIIVTVQEELIKLGYYSGAANGVFDEATANALLAFQYDNNITQSGVIDDETLSAMELAEILFVPDYDDSVTMSVGCHGQHVTLLREVLAEKGFTNAFAIPCFYCEITASLVADYQASVNLPPTGTADELTLSSLGLVIPEEGIEALKREEIIKQYYESNGALVILRELSSARHAKDTVVIGDEGEDVVLIQKRLAALGYYTGKIDGIFGKGTRNAVASFQLSNKLTNDGKCGARTRGKLFSGSAVDKATADGTKSKVDMLIAYAKTFLGTPYVYGANGPDAYDCTSYTKKVFAKFGITLPRSAYSQGYNNYGTKITSISDLKPGDLVFFNTITDNDLSDHAGIYIGNGQFIHCSSAASRMCVAINSLTSGFYNRTFSWARRVL